MNSTLQDIQDILDDLHVAEHELLKYEKKYGLRSDFFYDCFSAGLTEDDGNFDLLRWAGYFESKRALERRYRELILAQKPVREGLKSVIAHGVVAE